MRKKGSQLCESETIQDSWPQEICFRLGNRRITACGTPCDHHPNVLFLKIRPTILDRLLGLLQFLPTAWQRWLEIRYPEWFLPTRIVMKREKVNWTEEFDNEKEMYRALAPIQGVFVPKYYGEVECPRTETTGSRALILSDIGGIPLQDEAAGSLEYEQLSDMLWRSLRAVAELGVEHDDVKLDNYVLIGDTIMLIDFDSSYMFDGNPDIAAGDAVWDISQNYRHVHGRSGPDWKNIKHRIRC